MNNSRMALKTTGTTLKPSVAYNPGTLSEDDLESLKIGVAEELWDISNNFVQTNEILGDTFEKIDTLEIDRDNLNAKIEETYKLSVEGDKILAQKITEVSGNLEAAGKTLAGMIKDESTIRIDEDEALAKRINNLSVSMETEDNKLNASIKTEEQARVNADGALASQITTIKTEMDDNVSTITQTLSSTVNKLGEIENKWGVEMDANGKISGVSMNNNGKRSDFEVRADKFAFTDTSGGKSGGFSSSGGVTTFNGVIHAQSGTFKGVVNAESGTFNGTVNATDGVFNGTVNANNGNFNNVVIHENCTVLGSILADKLEGAVVDAVGVSPVTYTPDSRPDQHWNFAAKNRPRNLIINSLRVSCSGGNGQKPSIFHFTLHVNGATKYYGVGGGGGYDSGSTNYVDCGWLVHIPAGTPCNVSLTGWVELNTTHANGKILDIGAFIMLV